MASTISRVICRFTGRNSLLVLLAGLMFPACHKDEVMHLADTPEIRLIDVSADTIRQYQDVLYIHIGYKDGDGDLGFEDPQTYALFVRDIRLQAFDGFYVGPLAPPDAHVPIEGQLQIQFPSLFLFGNGDVELTRFEIKMVDRAGHESNVLQTGNVVITRN
jgi:hypothetical protein